MTEQTAETTQMPPPPAGEPEPSEYQDQDRVPGSKVTFGELRMGGVPDDIIKQLPNVVQAVTPRRVGLVEANGDWYLYRSLGRHEFKNIVKEATDRIVQKAQAAQKSGQELNPAQLNAESQSWLEERVSSHCALIPRLSQAAMNDGEAGVPKLVHDAVMARSNFEQTSEPIVL